MSQRTKVPVDRLSYDEFLELSEKITGFTVFELQATGMGEQYYEKVCDAVADPDVLRELRERLPVELGSDGLVREPGGSCEWVHTGCRIAELWYLGSWPGPVMVPPKNDTQRSGFTTDADGAAGEHDHRRERPCGDRDTNRAPAPALAKPISAEAYVESLVWKTFDGHPMGARPPGFGSWSLPPTEPRGDVCGC